RNSSAREACNVLPVLASMTIEARLWASATDGVAQPTRSAVSRRKVACHRRAVQRSSVSRIAYSLLDKPWRLRHREMEPLASARPAQNRHTRARAVAFASTETSGFWRLCGAQPPADHQLKAGGERREARLGSG